MRTSEKQIKSKSAKPHLLNRLVGLLHKHQWHTIGTNGFYMSIEEQCWNCGAKRHRILKAENLGKLKDEPWKPGPHPLANGGDERPGKRNGGNAK